MPGALMTSCGRREKIFDVFSQPDSEPKGRDAVFLPLKDNNPLVIIRWQFMTVTLITLNVLVFVVFQSGLVLPHNAATSLNYGMIPATMLDISMSGIHFPEIPGSATLLTYMFIHSGWMHLFSNMAFLWVFGDNIEDAMGHLRFLAFYLLSGIAAAFVYALIARDQFAPLVGASGAVSGIIGAYLMLHPRTRLWVLLFWRIPLKIPALLGLGGWVALQIYSVITSDSGNVAWWAHLGGVAAGIIMIPLFKHPEVPLFDRDKTH